MAEDTGDTANNQILLFIRKGNSRSVAVWKFSSIKNCCYLNEQSSWRIKDECEKFMRNGKCNSSYVVSLRLWLYSGYSTYSYIKNYFIKIYFTIKREHMKWMAAINCRNFYFKNLIYRRLEFLNVWTTLWSVLIPKYGKFYLVLSNFMENTARLDFIRT